MLFRSVVRNVAKLVSSPKAVAHEVRYLNDEQARSFLSCLQNEPDIRIKSAFTILLFTGCRRGELCGLSWQDIDEDNRMIHIRRQSQYIEGKGVTSTSTKTALSVRNIPVSPIAVSYTHLDVYKRQSSRVAPSVPKPVEVLIKSGRIFNAISQSLTFSFSVR